MKVPHPRARPGRCMGRLQVPWSRDKGGRLLLACYTSTGDHRGQVASKRTVVREYRREGFKKKGLGSGPPSEQRWVYLGKRLADGIWGGTNSLGHRRRM